jgi:phosphatidylserine decarboxylase
MPTPLRTALSHLVGWAADRRVPRPLRAPLYRAFARATGADLAEAELPPVSYPSLGALFVRRLAPGARPISADPDVLVSPVDGAVHSVERVLAGEALQVKGRRYPAAQLLGPLAGSFPYEGALAWTLYLGPRDYHRIHAPEACRVEQAWWIRGARHSVAPAVLARRVVLPINERVALLLATERGPLAFVMVGATNVGRMRVVGVDPERSGRLQPPPAFARGQELARFELGSTVVLLAPRGAAEALEGLAPGAVLRLGRPIGRWVRPSA